MAFYQQISPIFTLKKSVFCVFILFLTGLIHIHAEIILFLAKNSDQFERKYILW